MTSPTTASPESTRTPPPPATHSDYPDVAIVSKADKIPLDCDNVFPVDDLLSFEGLDVDPFGLEDIMNFPCQF